MIFTTEGGGLSLVLPEKRDARWRSDHAKVQREVIKQHLNAVPSKSIATHKSRKVAERDLQRPLREYDPPVGKNSKTEWGKCQ